jgi:hypothetical protein
MQPRDENNFLIEVTPEVMNELNCLYMHSDDEPIVNLHFSPYWKDLAKSTKTKEEVE